MTLSMATGPALRPDIDAAVTAARAAEFTARTRLVLGEVPVRLGQNGPPGRESRSLRVTYLVPRTGVGGGARILFEHANRLLAEGHEVLVLGHHPAPDWFDLQADFRQVPFGAELAEAVPDCDVIVAGYWEQVIAAASLGVAPVIHFEQGDAHLFEDLDAERAEVVRRHLAAADATVTVSANVASILHARYGVVATVLHNAVDRTVFHPSEPPSDAARAPYVMCVGWDGNEFKGMAEMRQVAAALAERSVSTVWVSPSEPLAPFGQVVVAPAQDELAALYRGAAAYVCCSHYESFPLPPMEAMASGAPVVTTRNVGALEYARHGENALVVDIGDVDGLLGCVERILDDPALAADLRRGGLETADAFSWDAIITRLAGICAAVAASWEAPAPDPSWTFDLDGIACSPGAREVLARRGTVAGACRIAIPVSRPGPGGLRVVRWEVAGRRQAGEGTVRVYLPANSEAAPVNLPYAAAAERWNAGDLLGAVAELARLFELGPDQLRCTVGRWLVLGLIELGQYDQAGSVAASLVEAWPYHPDLQHLRAMVAHRLGQPVDREAYLWLIAVLGVASFSDEWFDDVAGMARRTLAPTAGTGGDEILHRAPQPSPLHAGNGPYFVQQLTVSSELVGLPRIEVLRRLLAGKRVLHVGYADWPITDPASNLHVQLDAVCAELDGIDPNDDAAAVIGGLVRGRLFTSWEEVTDAYDVVLVPEVLEHVADVEGFFAQLSAVEFHDVLITVPDASQCAPRHFGYDQATQVFTEVVHPDHNAWYSPYTLYNVVTKYTDWTVRGMWFFNGISLMLLATRTPD